jgi:cysteinyl-tRNA synthetase
LYEKVLVTKQNIIRHFKDDFNTPATINELLGLIKETNTRLQLKSPLPVTLNLTIAEYFQTILSVLGFESSFETSNSTIFADQETSQHPKKFTELVNLVVNSRGTIRNTLLDKSLTAEKKVSALFSVSDNMRDSLLDEHFVEIQDRANDFSTWRQIDEFEYRSLQGSSSQQQQQLLANQKLLENPPPHPDEFLQAFKTCEEYSQFDEKVKKIYF